MVNCKNDDCKKRASFGDPIIRKRLLGNEEFLFAEMFIGQSYLISFGHTDFTSETEIKQLMKKYFSFIPVSELKPYKVCFNWEKIIFYDNFDTVKHPSIEKEEEIGEWE